MAKKGEPKTGGRKAGTPNKSTAEIRELAGQYAPSALAELARLSTHANSEQARVSACKEILDRAYGKSTQTINSSDKVGVIEDEISDLDLARKLVYLLTKGEAELEKKHPYN
jgi:DNA-binding MarR family transcriptional regulator